VFRHGRRGTPIPRFEDVAYLRLFYDDRCLSANIHVSWLDPCKVRRVTAVGSKKMAIYDDLAIEERIRVLDKGVSAPTIGDNLTQPPMSYRYGDIVAPFIASDEPLGVQDRHFIECIMTGATPLTDGTNGLAVVEVLEAAQLSLQLGRPVPIEELASGSYSARPGNGHVTLAGFGQLAEQPQSRADARNGVHSPRAIPSERLAQGGSPLQPLSALGRTETT